MSLKTTLIRATTALGAAYLAGLAVGFWKSRDELAECWKADAIFEPTMSAGDAGALVSKWREAVSRSLDWNK